MTRHDHPPECSAQNPAHFLQACLVLEPAAKCETRLRFEAKFLIDLWNRGIIVYGGFIDSEVTVHFATGMGNDQWKF